MWKRWALRIIATAVQEKILEAVMDLEPIERKAQAIDLLKQLKRYLRIRGNSDIGNLIPFEVD